MKRLSLVLSLFLFVSFSHAQTVDLVLGSPSEAKPDINQPENFLVEHSSYVLSYNNKRLAANWVAWHLQKSDLGPVDRSNDFRPDDSLPAGWGISGDTFGKPYDRGHMSPSGDRTRTCSQNSETFLMSNMQAQHKDLNELTWAALEDYIREVVGKGFEAYEYAGCYGGTEKIQKNGMTIPTNCWKVVLFLPKGRDDLNRITVDTRVVAVDMPNDGSTKAEPWWKYRTSVDEIENATGLKFFTKLSSSIRTSLKSEVDSGTIPPKAKKKQIKKKTC